MDPGKDFVVPAIAPPGYGSCKGLPLRNAWTCRDGRPTLNSIASPGLKTWASVQALPVTRSSPVLCTSKITFAVPACRIGEAGRSTVTVGRIG